MMATLPASLPGIGTFEYFQPDSLSHAARARGFAFSHSVMDRVSLLSIFSFMHMQYLRMIASDAPPLLSWMH